MLLHHPRIDLQQGNPILRGVVKVFDVERRVVETDVAENSSRGCDHPLLNPPGQARRVAVAKEGGSVGKAVRIHHPVDVDLALVDVPLHRALVARNDPFGEAEMTLCGRHLRRQVRETEEVIEGFGEAPDLAAENSHGPVKVARPADAEPEVAGVGLERLDPERIVQGDARQGILVEGIEGDERGDVLPDDLLLLQAAPIFVFALEHAFQCGRTRTEPLGENGLDQADRKVPEPDDRIDGTGKLAQLPIGLLQDLPDFEDAGALGFFEVEEFVKTAL